jgi:hypothetical protein
MSSGELSSDDIPLVQLKLPRSNSELNIEQPISIPVPASKSYLF